MTPPKDPEESAADILLVEAIRLEDAELEPTAAEIELFLAAGEEYKVFRTAPSPGEPSGSLVEAFAAMNRDFAEEKFSDLTEEELERKRKELLDDLVKRHEQTDE